MCGAIRADDLIVRAHIEIDMGMVERRQGADAHEFFYANFDLRNAIAIVEVHDCAVRHGGSALFDRIGGDHTKAV